MNITKALIAKKISMETRLNIVDSKIFLESFIHKIKKESFKKTVKIKNFGTFKVKSTKKRIGRNPKTKESYIIRSLKKLIFTSSNMVKKELN
tara:strand:+ start:229 stop:504 length:276 start_codon:yes stop_codon:yes gene_type:complete